MAEKNYRIILLEEGGNSSLVLCNNDLRLYRCTKNRRTVKYYACTEANCHARGKIVANGNFEQTSAADHNHANNHRVRATYLTAFEEARNNVRDNVNRSVISIHKEILDKLPIEVAGFFNWENCRQTLQRIRNRIFPPCRNMQDFTALLEDEESQVFEQYGRLYGERCYSGAVNGHLMFVNTQLLDALAGLVNIFIDGTFSVTPFKTRQLLVIMAELQGRPRAFFYAIMTSQMTEDYESIFQFLQDTLLGAQRRVLSVTSDFEQSIRAAVRIVWPQAEIIGCNFHYCQALEKNAKATQEANWRMVRLTDTFCLCLCVLACYH